MKQRTPNYVFTADALSVADFNKIQTIRETVSILNKIARQTAQYTNKDPVIYRVTVKGRLGKNNPNARKYRDSRCWNAYQTIKLEDAAYYDVYIQRRYS